MNIFGKGNVVVTGKGKGNVIRVNGNNICISNGVVTINGKKYTDLNELPDKEIKIIVEGNVEELTVDMCESIEVNGSAGNVSTHNGNVTISQGVNGNVRTHNGNVVCGPVGGSIDTHNGNIIHR